MTEPKKSVSLKDILTRGTSISAKNVVTNNGRETFIETLPEGLNEDLLNKLGEHRRAFSKDFTETQTKAMVKHMRADKDKTITNLISSFEIGGDTYEVAVTRPDGDTPTVSEYLAGIDSRVTMRAHDNFDETRTKLADLWTCDESEYDD